MALNDRILILSDLHVPYHHPDTVRFLTAVKRKYRPTRVISVGDEVDKHAMSFHDSDPDLPSAGHELKNAIKALQPLYKLFPRMDLVDSNHGSMIFRKAKHHGIPVKYLRSYRDVLEAPVGWEWHNDLLIKLPGGSKAFVTHGVSANGLGLAKQNGCCVIQGHYHNKFAIEYTSSPDRLNWSMQVGCSINKKSLAFAYNKLTPSRPILGHGMVLNGQPKLLPMLVGPKGRWTGKLY